jgi:hypothetical protein
VTEIWNRSLAPPPGYAREDQRLYQTSLWTPDIINHYLNSFVLPLTRETIGINPRWAGTEADPGNWTQTITGQPIRGQGDLGQFLSRGAVPEIGRTVSQTDAGHLTALQQVLNAQPTDNLGLAGSHTPDYANFDAGGAGAYLNTLLSSLNASASGQQALLQNQSADYLNRLRNYTTGVRRI